VCAARGFGGPFSAAATFTERETLGLGFARNLPDTHERPTGKTRRYPPPIADVETLEGALIQVDGVGLTDLKWDGHDARHG
jgi:hypothetical protein